MAPVSFTAGPADPILTAALTVGQTIMSATITVPVAGSVMVLAMAGIGNCGLASSTPSVGFYHNLSLNSAALPNDNYCYSDYGRIVYNSSGRATHFRLVDFKDPRTSPDLALVQQVFDCITVILKPVAFPTQPQDYVIQGRVNRPNPPPGYRPPDTGSNAPASSF